MELYNGSNAAWAIWKINETESALAALVAPYEPVPEHITNHLKRLEFLAGRVLIKELLNTWGKEFLGLTKDEFGKPYPTGHSFQLSLSHSYPYVAAIIDRHRPVGIDLEQPKEKLFKIASRVLDPAELENAGSDMIKHCIYWSAKEALVKIHGKKDLVFSKNLIISPFSREKQGELIGRIIVNNTETAIPLQYFVYDDFVVVLNK
jgi:4'-phosphopantetheinyl transferase